MKALINVWADIHHESIDCRAVRAQRMRECGATVVSQYSKQRTDTHQIRDRIHLAAAIAVKIVPKGRHFTLTVLPRASIRDNATREAHTTNLVVNIAPDTCLRLIKCNRGIADIEAIRIAVSTQKNASTRLTGAIATHGGITELRFVCSRVKTSAQFSRVIQHRRMMHTNLR